MTATLQTPRLSVLIVDDELSIRKTLAICLEAEGHYVSAVSNVHDAMTQVSERRFDVAFLDIRLGTESGIELLPRLIEGSPWTKIVMITAYASIDSVVEAIRRGAFDYIAKPFTSAQVLASLAKAVQVKKLEDQVSGLRAQLQLTSNEATLNSHSAAMQRAIELCKQVAPTEATVLITGESGVGKGEMAKAIHRWSPREGKAFGVVSCPSLSQELLESELFGHAKGAFTGAIKHNPGRIQMCEGGTLFLDEIGDLPLALQPKLLRFIQDREFENVGDTTTKRANVRIVAATNVDLLEAVRLGRFREDLYFRLNVIQVHVPSLRERIEDIPLLAEKFLKLLSGQKSIIFSEEAFSTLTHYQWPGNVRELRNAIERATILCNGESIEAKHLTFSAPQKSSPGRAGDLVTLEKLEEDHIRRVLAESRSMEEAAKILGIDTVTLWRRRKKYGV